MIKFDKQNVLDKLKTHDDKMLISRALDQALLCCKNHEARFTDFLDPYQQHLIKQQLGKLGNLNMHQWGGYSTSERNIISFFPEYMLSENLNYPLAVLKISGKMMCKLNHRDFLGSILGLGIRREKIGDILVNEESCFVFCKTDMKNYISMNLQKVANTSVTVEEINSGEINIPERELKVINATVASLRLDAILGASLGESRNKAQEYINADKVFVNWEPANSSSQQLKEYDIISVRGKGRMILERIEGMTRKGRVRILIKRTF